jgi:hypothetical protein
MLGLAAASPILAASFGLLSVSLPSTLVRHEVRLRTNASGAGAILEVHVNRQRLNLLLDTGARGIVLSAKAAARCGLAAEIQSKLSGIAGDAITAGGASATIDLQGLRIGAVPVRILPESPVRRADGLIGAQVFGAFLVEIDAPAGWLRLLSRSAEPGAIPVREVGHMLFVRLDSGYALVDTGSSFSVIDRGLAYASAEDQWTPARAATGGFSQAQRIATPARFAFPNGAILWDRQPVAMDLSALSSKHGLAVIAVIGYPALSNSVMQVDYLNKTIRILAPGGSVRN